MGRFQTDANAGSKWHRPVAMPSGKEGVFGSVRELLDEARFTQVRNIARVERAQQRRNENCDLHLLTLAEPIDALRSSRAPWARESTLSLNSRLLTPGATRRAGQR